MVLYMDLLRPVRISCQPYTFRVEGRAYLLLYIDELAHMLTSKTYLQVLKFNFQPFHKFKVLLVCSLCTVLFIRMKIHILNCNSQDKRTGGKTNMKTKRRHIIRFRMVTLNVITLMGKHHVLLMSSKRGVGDCRAHSLQTRLT